MSSTAVSSRVLKIYNCASVGNLEADAGSYVGGIAGNAVGSRIQSCLSSGTIQAKGMNGGKYVGGIVGYGGDVSYSMSSATLKGADYIGGIAGYASSAVIGCYTNVVLLPSTDAEYIGGIAGYASNYNVATKTSSRILRAITISERSAEYAEPIMRLCLTMRRYPFQATRFLLSERFHPFFAKSLAVNIGKAEKTCLLIPY